MARLVHCRPWLGPARMIIQPTPRHGYYTTSTPPTKHTATPDGHVVVPVSRWDDTPMFRSVVLHYLMRVDRRLDVAKLHQSLEHLLTHTAWRKLSARLRRDATGRLEYHVPTAFTPSRRPFAFHHEHHTTSIAAHPLASRLPRGATQPGRPEIVARGDDFIPLMRRPDDPRRLDDYLDPAADRPALGLHVVSFEDATLLTLSWSHVLLDGMGRSAFLAAWSLALAGRTHEVAPLADALALAPLGTTPGASTVAPYRHAARQLTTVQTALYGARAAVDALVLRPRLESRVLVLPPSFVGLLRATAAAATRPGERALSRGDILCAWFVQLVVAALRARDDQTVALNIAMGLRDVLGESGLGLVPTGASYAGNAVMYAPAFLSARAVTEGSLADVAGEVRQALVELGSAEQVEARARIEREALDAGGVALFGDVGMHMVVCTNLSKARLFDVVDFGPAVLQAEGDEGVQPTAKPSYVQLQAFTGGGFGLVSGFSINGIDAQGNTWLYGVLRSELWERIEEILASPEAQNL